MVVAEGMGRASGPATRDASSDRRGRQTFGCRYAPDVGRWSRVLVEQGGDHGSCGCLNPTRRTQEKPPSRRSTRSALAEKCPHGDDGWGEFVAPTDPAVSAAVILTQVAD